MERGQLLQQEVKIYISALPFNIAEREKLVLAQLLQWPESSYSYVQHKHSSGLGNVLCAILKYEQVTEVFSSFGTRGLKAETVVKQLISQVQKYCGQPAPVGEHLADQLLLPLALAKSGCFVTTCLTPHALTNISVIETFTKQHFLCEDRAQNIICVSL